MAKTPEKDHLSICLIRPNQVELPGLISTRAFLRLGVCCKLFSFGGKTSCMSFSFDRVIDRSDTPAIKYDPFFLRSIFGNTDVLPLWVADMEFEPAPFLKEAVVERIHRANLGYEVYSDSLRAAVGNWFQRRHAWSFDDEHLVFTPNVISALYLLLSCLTEKGDGVIVQTPVYAPLFNTIKALGRRPVYNSLLRIPDGSGYVFDFSAFRQMALQEENKVLILCNPHNPVGRVWREDELRQLMEIAQEGDVFVISDEIHGDVVYSPHRYWPLLSLPFVNPDRVAILNSPAKTFNIAGVTRAFAVIPDAKLRRSFRRHLEGLFLQHPGALAQVLMEAAYCRGDDWVDLLLSYLWGNIRLVRDFLGNDCLQIRMGDIEGTYLLWLDFSAYGLDGRALNRHLVESGLGLNPGYWFGREGEGFMRMNIACPRTVLQEALHLLKSGFCRD